MMIDSIIHATQESIKVIPFLFVAFIVMELAERRGTESLAVHMAHTGPLIGALAGCVPQCGFAAAAAKLWTVRRISSGTLIAIFISTSDEALLLLIGSSDHLTDAVYILLIKVIIAIAIGYAVDNIMINSNVTFDRHPVGEMLCKHSCCTGTQADIIITAAVNTLKLSAVILIFSAVMDIAIRIVGKEALSMILLTDKFLQPMMAATVGLIPGCVPSVMITQLYIEGLLSFEALMAGLISNAGIGLLIARSLPVTGILFITAIISSFVIQILPLS